MPISSAKDATVKPPIPAALTTRLRLRVSRQAKMPTMEARKVRTSRSSRLP